MGLALAGWVAWSVDRPVWLTTVVGLVLGGALYAGCGALLFREQMKKAFSRLEPR